MKKEYTIHSIDIIAKVVKEFAEDYLDKSKVFAFDAPMGSGKTTFIKTICEYLKVQDVINSPTFSIINEYYSEELRDIVYHFDCYRLYTLQDAINLGVEDYLDSGRYCFIEWPDVVDNVLPLDTVYIKIEEQQDGSRKLYCSKKTL